MRSLEVELRQIYREKWKPTYIELDKPIRDGWFRSFYIRKDIARREDAENIKAIIQLVSVKVWGREKKYCDKNWKRIFKKQLYHYQRPGIRYIDKDDYKLLDISQKKYFTERRRRCGRNIKLIYKCNLPRYYFVIKYSRAYITRRKVNKPELDRRIDEIERLLNSKANYKYLSFLSGNGMFESTMKAERRKNKMALRKECFW